MRRSTRISRTSQPDRVMRETRLKSRRTPMPIDLTNVDVAGLSVGGVCVTEMNRDTLRKHIRGIGLKPAGPLKADLQRCLCDHLRMSSCGGGVNNEVKSVESDEKVTNEPSPDCVIYQGIKVSCMETGSMSEIFEYLDVSPVRRDGNEMAHDLVKALVLRKAEATAINRKQRWRGGLVSKMNKTELTTALRSFRADDSGKVVLLRARFHKLVRRWATTEILLRDNVGGESLGSERCSHRGGVEGGKTSDDTRGRVKADTEAPVDWHQAADIPSLNHDVDIEGGGDTSTADDSDGVVVNPATDIPLRDNVGGESVDSERCSHRDGSEGAAGGRAGEEGGGDEKRKKETRLASGAEDEIKGEAEGKNTIDDTPGEVEADAVASVDWHQAADIPPVDRDGDTSTPRQADSAPISTGDSDGVVVNPAVTSPEPGANDTAEEAVAKYAVERSAGATAIGDASTDFTNDTVASVGAMESEVHPRDGMAEFEALLKGFNREDERDVMQFLKDPTVRPVDPSLPELTTEQEQRLATATSSPSGWDVDLILALNPFLEQGRQLVRDRGGRSNFGLVPAVSREDVSLNATVSSCATKRPAIDADIVLRNEEEMRKNLRPDVPDDRYKSTRPPSPDNVPPFTCQAPSRGTGSASKSMMGTPSVGWHARGRRGLKLPTRQDPYKPLVFKPRRSRPSFSGSNRRDESIAEWLGGPVDDTDAALGYEGGASGTSAEDSQGSRCQARKASRDGLTGSLGVASPSGLSTIEEAEVGEATVEAIPEPTVWQGHAEPGPIQSMGLPRLAGSSSFTDSVPVSADDDGEFGFTFTRCVRTKRGRSSADDGANLDVFVSNEDDCAGVFEFVTSKSASSRRVRPRGGNRDAKEVTLTGAPSITRECSTLPPQASTGEGFDMSLFKRHGEWKCETCLVRNPPEQQTCLSCEAAKHVAGQGEAAASGGSGLSAVPTPIIGGGLFAGDVPSNNHTFMFGSYMERETFEGRKEKLLADADGERNAEFGFPIRTRHRVPAVATKSFTFTRCVRTKRGRSSADDGADLDTFVSNDDGCSRVFEFATSKSASSRRVRPRGGNRDAKNVILTGAPSITHESSTLPPQASTGEGFDMSLFKRHGEWKCETCLVRNPPEQQTCLSCEAAKHVAGQGEAAASGGSGLLAVPTPIIGGGLFAGDVPSNNHTFMFGSYMERETFEGRKEKLLADADGERNAEFGFPIRTRHRVPAVATKSFTFTRCVRTKRGHSSVDDGGDLDAFVSAEDDSPGVFEFSTSKSASSRRTRRRVMIPPRVSGGHSSDNAAVMGTTRDLSTSSKAPAVKGFDMSLFKKPGEWKCEACLVRNPPGRDACLSCETPKPVVGRGGDSAHSGDTAVAPIAPSTIGGALFAGTAPSNNQTFTFGGKLAGD